MNKQKDVRFKTSRKLKSSSPCDFDLVIQCFT